MVMFMYTIYYIFLVMIIISFITGLILNIVENKHKKDKNKEEVLESENTMTRKVNNYTLADDEKFSKTISFSRPVIISSTLVGTTGVSSSNSSNITNDLI